MPARRVVGLGVCYACSEAAPSARTGRRRLKPCSAYGLRNWRCQRKRRSTSVSPASPDTSSGLVFDHFDLVIDDLPGRGARKQVLVGAFHATSYLTEAKAIPADSHELFGLAPCAGMRRDVVARCERQHVAVPEGGVIARVIVVVTDQDVEGDLEKSSRRVSRGSVNRSRTRSAKST